MHVAISLITILAVLRWADWKNWNKYHNTMLFIALGNLLYNFISCNHFLWRLNPDFLLANHSMTELLYTFIVFPGTVLLFLSNYPEQPVQQLLHMLKYIAIYIVVEWLAGVKLDGIIYNYGWNLGWSFLFVCLMFPVLRIHYSKPLLAYFLSVIIIIAVVLYFDIPIEVPIEDRK